MTTDCEVGISFFGNRTLPSVLSGQAVISFLAVLANLHLLCKAARDTFYHVNLRVITGTIISTNVIHSVVIAVLFSYHSYLMLTAKTPCDIQVPVPFCLAMRLPSNVVWLLQTTLNTALAIERIIATFTRGKYENYGCLLGSMLTAAALFLGGLSCYLMMKNTPVSMMSAYCTTPNKHTIGAIKIIHRCFATWEIFIIVLIIGLYLYNWKQQRKPSYNVSRQFQVAENIYVTSLLMPLMFLHFIIHTIFYAGSSTANLFLENPDNIRAQTVYSAFYVIPFYCLFSPLLLGYMRTKQKKHRAELVSKSILRQKGEEHNYLDLWK